MYGNNTLIWNNFNFYILENEFEESEQQKKNEELFVISLYKTNNDNKNK